MATIRSNTTVKKRCPKQQKAVMVAELAQADKLCADSPIFQANSKTPASTARGHMHGQGSCQQHNQHQYQGMHQAGDG